VSPNRRLIQNLSQASGPVSVVPGLYLMTRELGVSYNDTLFAVFGSSGLRNTNP
jgi:hypothetical protein